MSTKKEPKELAKQFYTVMYRMRRFEEEVFEFYKRGLMPGLAHLYLGEEAVAAGACVALREDDYIGSTHRGHGHLVARGADLDRMMAEILGKKRPATPRARAAPCTLWPWTRASWAPTALWAAKFPIATGAAYSAKLRGTEQVTRPFSATPRPTRGPSMSPSTWLPPGTCPSSISLRTISSAFRVDIRRVTKEHDLYKRAEGYGIPGEAVDGNDVYAVYEAVSRAVERARKGEGPTLIECKTYRWQGHHVGDPGEYRAPEELAAWKAREPLVVLQEKGLLSDGEIEEIRASVEKEIAQACKFAEESDYPDVSEAYKDVFVDIAASV